MMDTPTKLTTILVGQTRCPVCGAAPFDGKTAIVDLSRRYSCGATFSVSLICEAIVAADPCPTGSRVQADLMTREAAMVAEAA